MADTGKSRYTLNNPGEQGMEMRMLLAFGLIAVLLLGYQFLMPKPKPPLKPVEQSKKAAAPVTSPAAAAPAGSTAAPAAGKKDGTAKAEPVVQLRASAEQRVTIDTDLYRVVLSNKGAVVTSWTLKKYKDKRNQPLELINNQPADKIYYPFQIDPRGGQIEPNPNFVFFVPEMSADGKGVTYTYSDGSLTVKKNFQFKDGSYESHVSSEVTRNGQPVLHSLAWRGGVGDIYVTNETGSQSSLYYDNAERKVEYRSTSDVAKSPDTRGGNFAFAGLQDTYFAAVFYPRSTAGFEVRSFVDEVTGGPGTGPHPHVGVAFGAQQNEFTAFVGPKELELLDKLDPKLAHLVDFGWFELISRPLFIALRYVHGHWTNNWGWAIILLTVAINMVLMPLKISGFKNGRRMQALQPEIARINKRYEGVGMRDPRNQEKNEEMMALYKKHDVSLGGGCLPMLVQLPFFYGFFNVLRGAIELRHAEFLWIDDLSQPEQFGIRMLPVLMVITGLVLTRITPTGAADPQQQKMFLVMQLVLGFTFWNFSSGLVLYWLTGNLIGLIQQYTLTKFGDRLVGPLPQVAPAIPAKKKK